jgi:hypothetical protein
VEDIEIDDDHFMSFCLKFKYLGSCFLPELNDTADITERISQARKLFGFMNKQLLSNKKIAIDIRCRLYRAIVVNCQYSTRGKRKLSTERSRQIQTGSVPPWLSPQDVRADDVGYSRETDHEQKG